MDKKIELPDDKSLVIFCVTILALVAMWKMPEAKMIVNSVVSGLFGVAVGKALSK